MFCDKIGRFWGKRSIFKWNYRNWNNRKRRSGLTELLLVISLVKELPFISEYCKREILH